MDPVPYLPLVRRVGRSKYPLSRLCCFSLPSRKTYPSYHPVMMGARLQSDSSISTHHLQPGWRIDKQMTFVLSAEQNVFSFCFRCESKSPSIKSNSLRPHGLYRPQNSPGQNPGVGSLSLPQGIFPTQGSNPGLLYCRQILYQLNHKGSPRTLE